jgi:hypothetical protein
MGEARYAIVTVGGLAAGVAQRLAGQPYRFIECMREEEALGLTPPQIRRALLNKKERLLRELSGQQGAFLLADLSSVCGASLAPIIARLAEADLRGCFAIAPSAEEGMRTFLAGTALRRLMQGSAPLIVAERSNLMDGFWSSAAQRGLENLFARLSHLLKEVAIPYLLSKRRGSFLMVIGSSREPEGALASLALKAQALPEEEEGQGIVLAPADHSLVALETLVGEAQAALRISLAYKLAKMEETIAVAVYPLQRHAFLARYDPLWRLAQLDDDPGVQLPEEAQDLPGLPFLP